MASNTDLPSTLEEVPGKMDDGTVKLLAQSDEDQIFDQDPVIHEAVEFIRKQVTTSVLASSLKIGYYILKEFYHDSVGEARSQKPEKDISFRKLCDNPYLPLSKSNLNLMVRIAIQDRIFQRNGMEKDVEGLNYFQLCEITKLPSVAAKKSIVAEIKERRLSGRQTAERVKEIQGKQAEPEVHILQDWQLQQLRDLLGTYMSFGLMFDEIPIIVEPSPERWKELANIVKLTLQELTTVRAMFRELDAYLTVHTSGQSEGTKESDGGTG
ncbi:MAG: hypothetical protein ABSF90_15140 [Syntrophobacteraceae bacterium]